MTGTNNEKILVQDRPDDPAVTFLLTRESVRTAHSGSTLIDHLIGVSGKLRSWGCRNPVCLAGLYHSVYGTTNFRRQTCSLFERDTVRGLIGEEAERLAYDFSTLDEREFLASFLDPDTLAENGLPAAPPTLTQLDMLHLVVANWLEQFPRMKALQRTTHVNHFRRLRSLLLPAAAEELELHYGFDSVPAPAWRTLDAGARETDGSPLSVQVIDNLVPPHLMTRLTALVQMNIWRYGWRAAKTQTTHGFWHSHFAGDNEDGNACCENELVGRPLMAPVLELWKLVRSQLAPGQVPVRVYANGHTYGGDGHLHTDCDRPGHFTTIYYAHPSWEVNWAGETCFFDIAGRDTLHSVSPLPGRLVHFPGDIPHAARSPGRDCPALRAVVVIKSFAP